MILKCIGKLNWSRKSSQLFSPVLVSQQCNTCVSYQIFGEHSAESIAVIYYVLKVNQLLKCSKHKLVWHFWNTQFVYDRPVAVPYPDPALWQALTGQCTSCCCFAGVQRGTADAHIWTGAHNLCELNREKTVSIICQFSLFSTLFFLNKNIKENMLWMQLLDLPESMLCSCAREFWHW